MFNVDSSSYSHGASVQHPHDILFLSPSSHVSLSLSLKSPISNHRPTSLLPHRGSFQKVCPLVPQRDSLVAVSLSFFLLIQYLFPSPSPVLSRNRSADKPHKFSLRSSPHFAHVLSRIISHDLISANPKLASFDLDVMLNNDLKMGFEWNAIQSCIFH